MPEDSSEDVPEESVCMYANTMPTMPTIQALRRLSSPPGVLPVALKSMQPPQPGRDGASSGLSNGIIGPSARGDRPVPLCAQPPQPDRDGGSSSLQ
jgi:hypothetical protein